MILPPPWGASRKRGRRPQYAPDRNAGFVHMSLDINATFKQRTIAGAVTYFLSDRQPLGELKLDGRPDDVSVKAPKSPSLQVTTESWSYL